jgi:N-acetylglucosamine kinase-like BadF-type ATPase
MKCVLGFDGGGTKTEGRAMDLSGATIARGRGPASNPTRIGFAAAAAGVKQAAAATLAALKQPAEIAALCAGLAGTAQPENRDRMQKLLEAEFPGVLVAVRTDLDLALAQCPRAWQSCSSRVPARLPVGRDASGRQSREGGYGPSGSDDGSAFDIGRSAVAAVRAEPAKDAATELGRQILRHLGCANWAALDAKATVAADDVFPRVFPVVAASADAGNAAAQALLTDAAQKLAAIARRLAESLGISRQAIPLGKAGGTIGRSAYFDQALDSELRHQLPALTIGVVSADPAETAARIALRLISGREAER